MQKQDLTGKIKGEVQNEPTFGGWMFYIMKYTSCMINMTSLVEETEERLFFGDF